MQAMIGDKPAGRKRVSRLDPSHPRDGRRLRGLEVLSAFW